MVNRQTPAKEKIVAALEELLQKKQLEDIYVSDIVARSGVARKTFYRHFDDKYAAVNAYFAQFYSDTFERIVSGDEWEDALYNYLSVCEEKRDILLHAYNGLEYNGLRKFDIEMTAQTYIKYLEQNHVDISTPEMRFAIRIAAAGGTDMVLDWICGGMKESKEELVALLRRTLPPDISNNLFK